MTSSHIDAPAHIGAGLDIVRDVPALRAHLGGWRDAGMGMTSKGFFTVGSRPVAYPLIGPVD